MENSGHLWSFQRKGQTDRAAQGGRGHGKRRLATFPGNFRACRFQGKNRNLDPVRSAACCPLPTRSFLGYPSLSHSTGMAPLFQTWSLLDHTSEWAGQPHLLPVGTSVVPLEEVSCIDLEEREQGRREQRSRQRQRSGHGLEVGGHSSQHVGQAQQRSRRHSNRILSA